MKLKDTQDIPEFCPGPAELESPREGAWQTGERSPSLLSWSFLVSSCSGRDGSHREGDGIGGSSSAVIAEAPGIPRKS